MNIFVKLAAIIYRSYDDRGVDIPYFRAILTIVFIIFIHAIHIGLLFNIPSYYIMPWNSTLEKPAQWLFATIYFVLLIAIILLFFKKSRLDKVNVSQKQIEIGRKAIPIYFAFCIVLLVILLIRSGIEMGKINL